MTLWDLFSGRHRKRVRFLMWVFRCWCIWQAGREGVRNRSIAWASTYGIIDTYGLGFLFERITVCIYNGLGTQDFQDHGGSSKRFEHHF